LLTFKITAATHSTSSANIFVSMEKAPKLTISTLSPKLTQFKKMQMLSHLYMHLNQFPEKNTAVLIWLFYELKIICSLFFIEIDLKKE